MKTASKSADSPSAMARRICGYRTWQGYALVARIAKTTAKGVLLKNDTDELWLPRSHVRKVDERLGQVHVSDWIAQVHRDRLGLSDPLDIAGKRGMAREAAAEHAADMRGRFIDQSDYEFFH